MNELWLHRGLALSRALLADARETLRRLDEAPDRLVGRMEADFERATDEPGPTASWDEIAAAAARTGLAFVGDFATSVPPKRVAARLLASLPGTTLALTLPGSEYQDAVDRFLAGGLSASRLYQTTGLEERLPPFAWRPYARLLEEARRRGVRVRLIEPGDEPDFFRRHDAALAAIATLAAKGPVVALLGEIRLSDLGLSYARALQGRPRTRIVCDVTGPWFAHLRTGGSGRTAARLGPDLFAIVEQSPLAKLLTFVEWYALEEEGLDGSRLGSLFGRFARTIAERFELPPLPRRGPRVFAPGDPRVLAHVAAAGCCDAAALDHLEGRLRAGESRFLPEAGAVYLGHPSRSHVAEEAAHYVRACAGGAGIAAGTEDAFWSVAVHEMAGYLGSKVLAPYRRPPALPAANDRGPLDAEALAHVYGYQLAERIWRRLPDDPALSDLVRTLFMKDLVEPGAAKDLYFRSLSAVAGRNR